MGIPGLVANLCKEYGNYIILNKLIHASNIKNNIINDTAINTCNIIDNIDCLYFDFNCLIHPIARLLWIYFIENKIDKTTYESELIEQSILYMEKIIEYVKPSNYVAIYIDGVCPISKMNQQRQRRFASILDKEIMNNIRSKNNTLKEEYYDTNAITPGTIFMEKFHIRLLEYIEKRNKNIILPKLLYSSYHEANEGEHKIIQHIRKNITNKNIVIYGLDADLIILSMTIPDNYILLLREIDTIITEDLTLNNKTSKIEEMKLSYFNVKECKKCLSYDLSKSDKEKSISEISDTKTSPIHKVSNDKTSPLQNSPYSNNISTQKKDDNDIITHVTDKKIVDDFVFITLLLGNDFVPPCPTLNMRFKWAKLNGYNILIDCYKLLRSRTNETNKYIVNISNNKISINWILFIELLDILANSEQEFFVNHRSYRNTSKCNSDNLTNIQIFRTENLMFNIPDPLNMSNLEISYNIRKARFIHHYYGSKYCECVRKSDNKKMLSTLLAINANITDDFYNDKNMILNKVNYEIVMEDYIRTLIYIMYYYYYECPTNIYYYKHINAVLLTDLVDFLKTKTTTYLDNLDIFYNNYNYVPITPLMQLIYVLPPKSYFLLPYNIIKTLTESKSNVINIYNQTISTIGKRDMLHKSKLFQCPIVMTMPDIELIRVILSEINITKNDEIRNKLI